MPFNCSWLIASHAHPRRYHIMAVSTHFALLWSLFLWFCTVESFEYPLSKRAFTGDVCRVWGHQSTFPFLFLFPSPNPQAQSMLTGARCGA